MRPLIAFVLVLVIIWFLYWSTSTAVIRDAVVSTPPESGKATNELSTFVAKGPPLEFPVSTVVGESPPGEQQEEEELPPGVPRTLYYFDMEPFAGLALGFPNFGERPTSPDTEEYTYGSGAQTREKLSLRLEEDAQPETKIGYMVGTDNMSEAQVGSVTILRTLNNAHAEELAPLIDASNFKLEIYGAVVDGATNFSNLVWEKLTLRVNDVETEEISIDGAKFCEVTLPLEAPTSQYALYAVVNTVENTTSWPLDGVKLA